MWTAIMDVELLYTQDDDLVIEYQLKKTLNHNVACVGQLCSINECIDGMTQAFNSDVACGVTTPRYAKQLTLINAYFSQYQMERACGNTAKANEYLNLMNELVGGESSCGCSGSGSCSGSCGSSCSCDSCGDDNTPRWINTPGSTTQSILEQIQSDITNIQGDITTIEGNITTIEGDITTLQADVEALQPTYKVYTALMSQTGTNAPTAIVLENTIGSILWTRVSTGVYRATLADTFLIDKLFIPCPSNGFDSSVNTGGGGASYKLARNNDAIIQLTTSSTDDVLNYTPIEIRVYN
jgi:hypothetical protein